MAAPGRRTLRDRDIAEILNNSEFEDSSEDEEFIQRHAIIYESLSSAYEGSSDSSNSADSYSLISQGSPRSLGRDIGRRGRGRRRAGCRIRTRGGTRSRGPARPQDAPLWKRDKFDVDLPGLSSPSYLPSTQDPSNINDYVEEYLDDELYKLIVVKSNQTAIHISGKPLKLTIEECKTYVGITLLMSCINYPQLKMYWNRKYAIPIIVDSMSRDRYTQLRNSMKLVFDLDVTTEKKKEDKLWKVRPILDRVLQGCRAQIREQKISIDEMIIPFTGACAIRQYCPGKPHPTGLKAFVLANPNGMVCDILVYQGSTTFEESEIKGSLCENVVLKLIETLVPGHLIYCDRYFTTFKLIEELNTRGFKCTGTIMKNRIPGYMRNDIENDKCLSRKGRGSFDVLVREDKAIAITKWYDNKPVLFASSIHAADTVDEVQRYDKKLKQYISVRRPQIVKEYNTNMGGVDLADRLLSVCPARIRTNKWTVRFISHMLDLAIVNSWIKYKQDNRACGKPAHKILQLREFKMEFSELLIFKNTYTDLTDVSDTEEEQESRKRGRQFVKPLPPMVKRLHAANHLPDMQSKQQRCRYTSCTKKTTVLCITCNMHLCLTPNRNCFIEFHRSH
ncbi:piggyBac transposable element-derived protein 3-like [Aricia agestis]|uniref:piggyBac transposable element-derived protein 3-like n=1 Tax=Aricia agestis TaxID=91739 RepID=UPI001C20A9AF|nr:piggyBac transposable element-derived protein 3-like [Aricia agestis]